MEVWMNMIELDGGSSSHVRFPQDLTWHSDFTNEPCEIQVEVLPSGYVKIAIENVHL